MRKHIYEIRDMFSKLMYVLNRQQKKLGVLVFILSFIGAILETLGVSLIIPLLNALLSPKDLADNKWFGHFFEIVHIENDTDIILCMGAAIILVYILKNLFFIALSWIRAKYACKVQRELSIKMMKTYMGKGYPFFLTTNTSKLIRGVFADVNGVYSLLNQLFKLVIEVLTVCLICAYIINQDYWLAICVVILATICLLIIVGIFQRKMKKSGVEHRKYSAIVNQNSIQAFQGIKEVIVSGKQSYFVDNFEKAFVKQQKASIIQTIGTECPSYVIEGIFIAGLLSVIVFRIAVGGADASAMIPTLSAFAVGAFRILPALGKISAGYNAVMFYIPNLNEMYKMMKDSEDETYNLDKYYVTENNTENVTFEHQLCIKSVSFHYPNQTNNVLNDLNLTIKKGNAIAFVGHSGAGKTTLADIILGLLKPQKGDVLIDDKSVFAIGNERGKFIGYVPQSVYLIDDSIRKNVAFGERDNCIDDEMIWKALEQAQLKEFVQGLEDGLDTQIGERGVRFSGGQRQRIAIARALYKNPEILIFDEATAALDNDTERAVMESIEALQGHKTLIIIAHRLTTVKTCDEIYEIKDGKAFRRRYEELIK